MKINLLKLMSAGILASFCLALHAQEVSKSVKVYMLDDEICTGASINGVSNNGEYAVGFSPEFTKQSFIWKKSTGQVSLIDGSLNNESEAYDVSDDGTVVGCFKDPYSLDKDGLPVLVPGYWKDGEWTKVETIKGLTFVGGGLDGTITSISSDGKIMSGLLRIEKGTHSPAIWKNDKLEPLFEEKLLGQGAASFAMSEDGTVLGGWAEHHSGARSASVWVNGKMTRITGEVWDDKIDQSFFGGEVTDISPNGKYVVGYHSEDWASTTSPFVWTQEEGRTYIAESGICMAVLDDGTLYGTDGMGGTAFIQKNEKMQTLLSYLQDNYNYEGEEIFCTPMGCSADGKVIGGWSYRTTPMGVIMGPWMIVMEETTNIAENETASLTATINGRTLTFSDEVSGVTLTDLAGKTVYSGTQMNGAVYQADQLAEGIYMLTLSNAQGAYKTQKIAIK